MADFMIRFLFCNLFISMMILLILFFRRLFRNSLTNRMKYRLWILFLGLLAVPFLPLHSFQSLWLFSWPDRLRMPSPSNPMTVPSKTSIIDASTKTGWFHDFTLSVNRDISTMVGTVLLIIWLIGMMVMITRTLRSLYHLRKLKQSALPLQNKTIQSLS